MLTIYFIYHHEKVKFIPITFKLRKDGKNSINLIKNVRIGWKAVGDFRKLCRKNDDFESEEFKVKRKKKFYQNIVLAVFMFMAAISVAQGVHNAIGIARGSYDFQYDSALLLRLKINPYDESLNPKGISEQLGLFEFYDRLEANQFPSLLAILIPLTFLNPMTANITWMIINLLLTGIIILLSRELFFKKVDTKIFIILACAMLAGTGWRNSIGNGQHAILSYAFYLIAFWLSEKKQRILSGVALAVSYFKYTLTVPLTLYFIYKKRYKEILISVTIHLLCTLLCALWLDDSLINMIKKPLEISAYLSSDGYIDFGSIFHFGSYACMLVAIAFCLVLFGMSVFGEKTCYGGNLLFAILSYVSLIIIYHRVYDFFILMIPMGIFVYQWIESKQNEGINQREKLINMIMSVLIFVYANFIQKAFDVLKNRVEMFSIIDQYLQVMYAIAVYAFVVYLMFQYCRKYSAEKRLMKAI